MNDIESRIRTLSKRPPFLNLACLVTATTFAANAPGLPSTPAKLIAILRRAELGTDKP